MRDHRGLGEAPDYTGPFLVSLGVMIFNLLLGILAIWGMIAALFSGWSMDRLIVFGGRRSGKL